MSDEKLKEITHHLKDLEEFLFFLNILSFEEITEFIEKYKSKDSKIKAKNEEIDLLIKKSHDTKELLEELKAKLTKKHSERTEELKKEISDLRKEGKDTYIVELKIIRIPQKIRLFEVTQDKKDYYKIIKAIEEIEQELVKVKKAK